MAEPQVRDDQSFVPRILVLSTNNISDPGIDLAGSSHMHYSPNVMVISVPCTSGIKPSWALYAIAAGLRRRLRRRRRRRMRLPARLQRAHLADHGRRAALLEEHGYEPQRLRMAAICSVCAEPFTNYMHEFSASLAKLGPSRKASAA